MPLLECQRRTGAVISNQARFRLEQISFAGKTMAWTRMAESGNVMTYHFCMTCGSTVFWENEGFPGHVTIAIGNFADPSFPAPTIAVWEERATPGSPYRLIHRQIAPKSRDRSFWGRSRELSALSAAALAAGSDAIRGSGSIQKDALLAWHVAGLPDRGPPPFGINVVIALFLQSMAECADATSPVYRDGAFSPTRELAGGRLRSRLTVLRQVEHAIRGNFLRRGDCERHDG